MIDVLTSFRFIAAFFVFMHHTVNGGMGYGERGVTYFFVLSGFILAFRYYDKFNSSLKTKDLLSFYSSRISRIYPVHILTFVVSILLSFIVPATLNIKYEYAFTNIFLLQWLSPSNIFTFNPASWSLSVEMIFYMLCPFLLYGYSKVILKGKTIDKVGFPVLFFSMIVLFTFQSSVAYYVKDTSDSTLKWWLMYVSPFRATDFSMGILLAMIYLKCKKLNLFRKNISLLSLQSIIFTTLEGVAIILAFIAVRYPIIKYSAAMFSVNYIPSIAVLILVFSFQYGVFSKILSQKLFVILGEISFSFFMIHYFVIAIYHGFLKKTDPSYNLHILCISIFLSALVYQFYELPMRDKTKSFLSLNLNKFVNKTDLSKKEHPSVYDG